jgi:4-alpha-glucanotransferase
MTDSVAAIANVSVDRRRAGVLAHITSVPSAKWPGTLGENAERFLRWLAESGLQVWQMLPLGPPHANDSPYQCQSAHAANLELVDKQALVDAGWLDSAERSDWLAYSWQAFTTQACDEERRALAAFEHAHVYWVADFSIYSTLKRHHGGAPWWEWPVSLRRRNTPETEAFCEQNALCIQQQTFGQYLFQKQWLSLRQLAGEHGVSLFGDMPIFVAHDSADVWAHRELFKIDEDAQLKVVAGVPPDAFSETGQRWGNPHYDWAVMGEDGFLWWRERVRTELSRFDIIRVDHFRGFESAWEIPAHESTGQHGTWQPAPGVALFKALELEFGALPLVAEDLGLITEPVNRLRRQFAIPGMKVLQFAFDSDAQNPYLPHNHRVDSVVYTGTHDNDTSVGWFATLPEGPKRHATEYLGLHGLDIADALLRTALQSVSSLAVVPMQDLLKLDTAHRMNTPATVQGNWRWQFS